MQQRVQQLTGTQMGGCSAPHASYGLNVQSDLGAGRGCSEEESCSVSTTGSKHLVKRDPLSFQSRLLTSPGTSFLSLCICVQKCPVHIKAQCEHKFDLLSATTKTTHTHTHSHTLKVAYHTHCSELALTLNCIS